MPSDKVNTTRKITNQQQKTYESGKAFVANGSYDEAKAEFSKIGGVQDVLRTDILAQRRSSQINEILNRRVKPAAAYVPIYQNANIGIPQRLPPTKLHPDLWFVGSAATYRSLYSDRSFDNLSKLLRLAKPKNGESPQVGVDSICEIAKILIGYVFSDTPVISRADILTPVPSDKRRYQQRGYSIPTIFAKQLAASCCIPMDRLIAAPNGLPELRSIPQGDRAKALRDAFNINEQALSIVNRSILIVDDVVTTGSTLREISRTLISAGASEVAAVTLAHSEN